jgi:hypothetical protein
VRTVHNFMFVYFIFFSLFISLHFLSYLFLACESHEECRKKQIGDDVFCLSLSCDSLNVEDVAEMSLQCDLNSDRCAILNGVCGDNPCVSGVGGGCAWGCKKSGETCITDGCAAHDVRGGDGSSCLSDVANKCIYANNRCEVDPCSFHADVSSCVNDMVHRCVYDGLTCSQGTCEAFSTDLNLCGTNSRCVVISGTCHENPCGVNSCDENVCIMSSGASCTLDPCVAYLPTDAYCGSVDGCVVRVSGANRMCISGDCGSLLSRESCDINGKCVYSKNACSVDSCQGLNSADCRMNTLCYSDSYNNCVFDLCSEGSGLGDKGAVCISEATCGYEPSDDTCKIVTSQFTEVIVGSISGVV